MENKYSDKEINKLLTLYTLLGNGKKEAAIQYLDDISNICKIEDQTLRKSLFRDRIKVLLDSQ